MNKLCANFIKLRHFPCYEKNYAMQSFYHMHKGENVI